MINYLSTPLTFMYCSMIRTYDLLILSRWRSLWLTDPFISCTEDMDIHLQEEMIELQNDTAMKIRFSQMGGLFFWIQDATRCHFPLLSEEAKQFARPFPTSFLVEKGFSAVTRIQDKTRNRMDVVQCGDPEIAFDKN
ncbi:hypothetical protein chiPu_0023441 [Chiloscyllium punctatum]|uniref:HAT C-terminal dimerisation domain-containing protein n=1 Tax=Chiloscyllium punctatum TaxID=137246 RepID=A0A401TBH2_CHIPU|nr:hypothetical protein [Chiloscyllium punctatum]